MLQYRLMWSPAAGESVTRKSRMIVFYSLFRVFFVDIPTGRLYYPATLHLAEAWVPRHSAASVGEEAFISLF